MLTFQSQQLLAYLGPMPGARLVPKCAAVFVKAAITNVPFEKGCT
jgi:hypothetical protein